MGVAAKELKGQDHVVGGSVHDPSTDDSLWSYNYTPNDNPREQKRRENTPAPNTATERAQATVQDYEYDEDEEDTLLGVAGVGGGMNSYQQLNSRQAKVVKVEAQRGKDRALNLLQVLTVSMDVHTVEAAGETLRCQLGTRPYGNDPSAGINSDPPQLRVRLMRLKRDHLTCWMLL